LKQRQTALAHCSCAKALSDLLAREDAALVSQQLDLSSGLKPLIGTALRSASRPLNFEEAKGLDLALQAMLKHRGDESVPMDARIENVRRLL